MFPSIVRALLCGFAFGSFFWNEWGSAAALAAVLGGILAGILRKYSPLISGRKVRCDFISLFLLVLIWCLLALASSFIGSPILGLSTALVFPALLLSFIGTGCLLEVVARCIGLRFLEPIVIGVGFCWPLLSSSGGKFVRPQWLSDIVVEYGGSMPMVLSFLGICAAILSTLALLESSGSNKNQVQRNDLDQPHRKQVGVLAILLLASLGAWSALNLMGPVKQQSLPPPPPPVSFAGEPPPPPPPEPQPLVAIQFSKVYSPAKRLGGYFFRKAESKKDEKIDTATTVESKVYYLDASIDSIALVGLSDIEEISIPGRRFKRAEMVRTVVSDPSSGADFDTKNIRRICEIQLATDVPVAPPKEVRDALARIDAILSGGEVSPEGSFLQEVASTIKKNPTRADSRLLRATGIVDWIEWNGDFSTESKSERSIVQFLQSGMKGNAREFSELAVGLLQAAGIKARLAEGFFHPAESVPSDRFVLTDSHKDCWPEVLTEKGDWLVLPVRPKKVSERDTPPPQEDFKQQLFDEIEKQVEPPKTNAGGVQSVAYDWRKSPFLQILGLVAVIGFFVELVRLIVNPLRKIYTGMPEQIHSRLLHQCANVAERKFRQRQFGESWEMFSQELGSRYPSLGRRFSEVLKMHAEKDRMPSFQADWCWLYLHFAIVSIFPRFNTVNRKLITK